jgi:4-amino-4-deoxy-L-arabinose transferase-like glycosyltransferase
MNVSGQLLPVDLRMPGYPAFLAFIYALTGQVGEAAHRPVMFVQIFVDLMSCLVTASLAAIISSTAYSPSRQSCNNSIFTGALWFAVLCPFTANYTAVVLTEVFAIFFTTLALLFFASLFLITFQRSQTLSAISRFIPRKPVSLAIASGLCTGLGTLFRPETPLLLATAILVYLLFFLRKEKFLRTITIVLLMCGAAILPLVPWAIRNRITLHEIQFLAPRNSMLPGELDPVGFVSWEKTWLYRFRDCYLVPWKLNDEPINIDDIPSAAFDTPEEKERVNAILDQYNEDLTLTPDEDSSFAQLARERTARHPLRTYLWLPLRRSIRIWFTPRIELLPFSGNVFPLALMAEEDPIDQRVTIGLFLLNIIFVSLAIFGAIRLWTHRAARPAFLLIALYIILRTIFLSSLETPEPRYVLVCFPALIALAAQLFAERNKSALRSALAKPNLPAVRDES